MGVVPHVCILHMQRLKCCIRHRELVHMKRMPLLKCHPVPRRRDGGFFATQDAILVLPAEFGRTPLLAGRLSSEGVKRTFSSHHLVVRADLGIHETIDGRQNSTEVDAPKTFGVVEALTLLHV